MKRFKNERGTAMLEAAMTVPMLLLVAAGIFEFGRAYQTWQILTNAAREAARAAVVPYAQSGAPEARARDYMQSGQLSNYASASVSVNTNASISIGGTNASATEVTINYPFQFVMLQPVARLVQPETSLGGPLTMTASAIMRNETQ
jgi:Flp pilus assembly protein TadG